MNAKSEAYRASAAGSRIHTWKMESMSLGKCLDWFLPDCLGSVSRDLALNVQPSQASSTCGDVARSALELSCFVSIPTMVRQRDTPCSNRLRGKGENPIGVRRSTPTDGSCWPSAVWSSEIVAIRRGGWLGSWPTCARVGRALRYYRIIGGSWYCLAARLARLDQRSTQRTRSFTNGNPERLLREPSRSFARCIQLCTSLQIRHCRRVRFLHNESIGPIWPRTVLRPCNRRPIKCVY